MDNATREESTEPMSLYEDPETYTEETYNCVPCICSGADCTSAILYVVEPEYTLHVGFIDGLYPEITFSPLPGEEVNGRVDPWSQHIAAIDKLWQVHCSDCGQVNQYVLTASNSIVWYPDGEPCEARIPRNRVPYVTTPKEGWKTS